MNRLPPVEILDALFRADFDAGKLWWKDSPLKPRRAIAHAEAGSLDSFRSGRCIVQVFGRKHWRYRILWAMYHRSDPFPLLVDHKDRDPTNDSIKNLRRATHSQNLSNQDFEARSGTLPVGVHYSARPGRRKRFSARIQIEGRVRSLGYFSTADQASQAYKSAAEKRIFLP